MRLPVDELRNSYTYSPSGVSSSGLPPETSMLATYCTCTSVSPITPTRGLPDAVAAGSRVAPGTNRNAIRLPSRLHCIPSAKPSRSASLRGGLPAFTSISQIAPRIGLVLEGSTLQRVSTASSFQRDAQRMPSSLQSPGMATACAFCPFHEPSISSVVLWCATTHARCWPSYDNATAGICLTFACCARMCPIRAFSGEVLADAGGGLAQALDALAATKKKASSRPERGDLITQLQNEAIPRTYTR